MTNFWVFATIRSATLKFLFYLAFGGFPKKPACRQTGCELYAAAQMSILPQYGQLLQKFLSRFPKLNAYSAFQAQISKIRAILKPSNKHYGAAIILDLTILLLVILFAAKPAADFISPLIDQTRSLKPLKGDKGEYEVFGFAPYWTFKKLDNVNFSVLTTFAYFGIDVDRQGNLDRESTGYKTFMSDKATQIFKKAHKNGTSVVLTLTQMENDQILSLMGDPSAQQKAIDSAVDEVKKRGIDGINVDFEYVGNPGSDYRNLFTTFVQNLTDKMHREVPGSKVSVSVYASAVKNPKIYDINKLGQLDIEVFMMAYDFGYRGSDQAIPTSPLFGHKSGKYWYDISTAVDDFIAAMPSNKLVLGTPWYGYDYAIYGNPTEKAAIRPSWTWGSRPTAQTYSLAVDNIKPDMEGISDYKEGWDNEGQVGWKAYYVKSSKTWRMIFLDDPKSLGIKYDFAKQKNLAGVGIWALGYDNGRTELWSLLSEKFGIKLADANVLGRVIN